MSGTKIHATGARDGEVTPTVYISTPENPEGATRHIHIAMRDDSGERSRLIQGHFPVDDVLDAIVDAEEGRTETVILAEPAA